MNSLAAYEALSVALFWFLNVHESLGQFGTGVEAGFQLPGGHQ